MKSNAKVVKSFIYHKVSDIAKPFWGLRKSILDELQLNGRFHVQLDHLGRPRVLTQNQVMQMLEGKNVASDGEYKIAEDDLRRIGAW